jgi:protocatechuate 3,4-dioxygenase beta subunit
MPAEQAIDTDVPVDWPPYKSTRLRHPGRPLVPLPERFADLAGPVFGEDALDEGDTDLTRRSGGEAVGERIIVQGRVLDEDGRPLSNALVEIWQANAAGRYLHDADRHPAPLDPHFDGAGRCLTDSAGRYRFTTVKPGAYPWGNHPNAWRPAHIHFSLFGRMLAQRLVTQMYFPGDPLFEYDPIFQAVRDPRAQKLLVATLDLDVTEEEWALGYTWDVVLGRGSTVTPPDPDA